MNKLSTILFGLATVGAFGWLAFYASVGFACLHMTAPVVQADQDCDMVQRHNGRLWCMNQVASEDSPVGTMPAPTGTKLELTSGVKINPQLTIQAEELQ